MKPPILIAIVAAPLCPAEEKVEIARNETVKVVRTYPSPDGKYKYVADATAAPDLTDSGSNNHYCAFRHGLSPKFHRAGIVTTG